MSYQQKSIWLSLVAMAVVLVQYLVTGGAVATITLLAAIQIVGQLVIRVTGGKEPKDERDNLIEAKAYRVSYLFLVLGVIVCLNLPSHPTAIGPFFLALMIAEVGKCVTQLVSYHRGA